MESTTPSALPCIPRGAQDPSTIVTNMSALSLSRRRDRLRLRCAPTVPAARRTGCSSRGQQLRRRTRADHRDIVVALGSTAHHFARRPPRRPVSSIITSPSPEVVGPFVSGTKRPHLPPERATQPRDRQPVRQPAKQVGRAACMPMSGHRHDHLSSSSSAPRRARRPRRLGRRGSRSSDAAAVALDRGDPTVVPSPPVARQNERQREVALRSDLLRRLACDIEQGRSRPPLAPEQVARMRALLPEPAPPGGRR
jgi:hypothetical protein